MKSLWMTLMLLVFIFSVFTGCASIPWKSPTAEDAISEAVNISGYFVGKTVHGQEALDYTTAMAGKDILFLDDFESWQNFILDMFVDDLFLKARLQTMVRLIDVDTVKINLATQKLSETTKYVRRVLSDFISGLKMGLSGKRKLQVEIK